MPTGTCQGINVSIRGDVHRLWGLGEAPDRVGACVSSCIGQACTGQAQKEALQPAPCMHPTFTLGAQK